MGSVNCNDDVHWNRLPDIRYRAKRMRRTTTVPEMEIFDSGMLPTVRALVGDSGNQLNIGMNRITTPTGDQKKRFTRVANDGKRNYAPMGIETHPWVEKEVFMDFSNMSIADWIIRSAIFGVLACVVIGTIQNLYIALKNSRGK